MSVFVGIECEERGYRDFRKSVWENESTWLCIRSVSAGSRFFHFFSTHSPSNTRMTSTNVFVIGTRKSALAMAQTVQVQNKLKDQNPSLDFTLLGMTTTGDKIQGQPLSSIGTTALFTRELEIALENKECHMLVHSLKDVPTKVKAGFVIGAMMEREEPNDVVVMRPGEFRELKDFGEGDVIGTSSVRRASQVRRLCPGVQVKDVVRLSSFITVATTFSTIHVLTVLAVCLYPMCSAEMCKYGCYWNSR